MADADEAIIGQLRQVFDLCDEERCGYITSDKLRQLGREHFAGSEQTDLFALSALCREDRDPTSQHAAPRVSKSSRCRYGLFRNARRRTV
ncbi:hypothetical protein HPB49_024684 [Dermacentor silvarum]|uniref:Uncharacterized protein n=2 Tax=Dermacentor silvarum TaxID=543639 RepID=A0ACB8CTL5_DERSI|nr:hypothetical protein HPB49_017103 [Dermacentor silvarum]KAH7950499.1 hypothetical protein HPB49_024684 [Dermacentor silvarum]